jgi:hypothetical protein
MCMTHCNWQVSLVPPVVQQPGWVLAVAACRNHGLALLVNGTVVQWGNITTAGIVPESAKSGAMAISCNDDSSFAYKVSMFSAALDDCCASVVSNHFQEPGHHIRRRTMSASFAQAIACIESYKMSFWRSVEDMLCWGVVMAPYMSK